MYTGTLIADLIRTVDHITHQSERQLAEELHEIFTLQIPVENEQTFVGAA
jgi:hypothetical protein